MPFEPKVKLGIVGNSYRVTIPMDMIVDLGWKEGDILRVGMGESNLTIRRDKQ
jgi:antitoxin component of MazEF toxin-antitoxin module